MNIHGIATWDDLEAFLRNRCGRPDEIQSRWAWAPDDTGTCRLRWGRINLAPRRELDTGDLPAYTARDAVALVAQELDKVESSLQAL